MQTELPWFDSDKEATKHAIQHSGMKLKQVAAKLYPQLSMDSADEMAELQRTYIEAVRQQSELNKRMERLVNGTSAFKKTMTGSASSV